MIEFYIFSLNISKTNQIIVVKSLRCATLKAVNFNLTLNILLQNTRNLSV